MRWRKQKYPLIAWWLFLPISLALLIIKGFIHDPVLLL